MYTYTYIGSNPVAIPIYSLMDIKPGDVVTTPDPMNHPLFQPV